MRYACQVCGAITEAKRCPEHQPTKRTGSWSPNRDRSAQARFRREVLARDGHRCTFLEDGRKRCDATTGLRAAHYPIPLRDFAPDDPAAYDPNAGVTLCAKHDRQLDPKAR